MTIDGKGSILLSSSEGTPSDKVEVDTVMPTTSEYHIEDAGWTDRWMATLILGGWAASFGGLVPTRLGEHSLVVAGCGVAWLCRADADWVLLFGLVDVSVVSGSGDTREPPSGLV